jgi:hypothetical protein
LRHARTIVALLERKDSLPPFASFHMAGHWDADGTQMAAAIERRGGHAQIRAFPWWLLRLASPFMTTLRELLEMRYLWRQAVRMDSARLTTVLGFERCRAGRVKYSHFAQIAALLS